MPASARRRCSFCKKRRVPMIEVTGGNTWCVDCADRMFHVRSIKTWGVTSAR